MFNYLIRFHANINSDVSKAFITEALVSSSLDGCGIFSKSFPP